LQFPILFTYWRQYCSHWRQHFSLCKNSMYWLSVAKIMFWLKCFVKKKFTDRRSCWLNFRTKRGSWLLWSVRSDSATDRGVVQIWSRDHLCCDESVAYSTASVCERWWWTFWTPFVTVISLQTVHWILHLQFRFKKLHFFGVLLKANNNITILKLNSLAILHTMFKWMSVCSL